MLYYCLQPVDECIGQCLCLAICPYGRVIGHVCVECATLHDAVDVHRRCKRVILCGYGLTWGHVGSRDKEVVATVLLHLSKVVEAYQWHQVGTQWLIAFPGFYVLQDAVAHSLVRNGPEGFLHHTYVMTYVPGDALCHYRIDGGEPAYGSVCHERLMHGLTTMAFHPDGYIGLACQLPVGLAQGCDEQVVDVRVVGMAGRSEQLTDGFSAQADIQCLTLSP